MYGLLERVGARVRPSGPSESRRFLLVEGAADPVLDDEALGPVVEVVEVDESPNVEIASPLIDHMPSSPRRWPSLLSRAATLWITIVYCWRSSSASANRNARSSCSTNSAMVQ